MARIAGVNIPTQKRVVIALQYIHGIGNHYAKEITENYAEHSRAAREIAEDHFDSDKVLSRLLEKLRVQ